MEIEWKFLKHSIGWRNMIIKKYQNNIKTLKYTIVNNKEYDSEKFNTKNGVLTRLTPMSTHNWHN